MLADIPMELDDEGTHSLCDPQFINSLAPPNKRSSTRSMQRIERVANMKLMYEDKLEEMK